MGSARTLTLKEVQELFPDRVLLYIKKGEKGPFVSEWQKTTFDKTQTAWYRNQLKSYPNTGVLLGHRSSGITPW
jgi:hypothetical protein